MILQYLHQEMAHRFLLLSPKVHPNTLGIWFDCYKKVVWEVTVNEGSGQRVEAGFVEWGLRPLYSLWFRRIFGRLRDPFGNHLCMVQLRTPQAYPHCSFPFCCACDAPYPYCLKRLICITSFKFSYIFFFYIFNTVIYCVTKLN